MSISFEGKVAIVTGAGNGLGKEHALELAKRGCKVVVNDFGGSVDGKDGSQAPADLVVEQIVKAGGQAISNGANVCDVAQVQAMVQQTVDTYGKVDILVNNAGILRDKSFVKVTEEDFRTVVEVHLFGTVNCTKAVWNLMREQNYGRIVNTTSSSGLYGNFGQTNYGAAKMGVVGLMNTLKLEGAKYNIKVNAVAPVAYTRMTDDLMGEGGKVFDPKSVTPGVVFLCSDQAPDGHILSAGAGVFARVLIQETKGLYLDPEHLTVENVAAGYDQVTDLEGIVEPRQGGEQGLKIHQLIVDSTS